MRGNRPLRPRPGLHVGSIPACAGEPPSTTRLTNSCTVYPRVCGGTDTVARRVSPMVGLSPRVRGNHELTALRKQFDGSIPACAGEPSTQPPHRPGSGVYPRVCGGTRVAETVRLASPGLSPRVRGNRLPSDGAHRLSRSIPACAGEPSARSCRRGSKRVYPRVCGGTRQHKTGIHPPQGLSPRVRGNLLYDWEPLVRLRSIPACAGNPRG